MTERSAGEVTIREVLEEDLETFYEDQLDEDAVRMVAMPSRDHDAHYEHWRRIMADDTGVLRTVVFEGRVAGNVVSWLDGDRRNIGYWIGKGYWGRGIATRALSLFVEELHDRPLHAHVAKSNAGSIRVLEKCGFTLVAEQQSEIPDDGVEEQLMVLE